MWNAKSLCKYTNLIANILAFLISILSAAYPETSSKQSILMRIWTQTLTYFKLVAKVQYLMEHLIMTLIAMTLENKFKEIYMIFNIRLIQSILHTNKRHEKIGTVWAIAMIAAKEVAARVRTLDILNQSAILLPKL